MGQPMLRFVAKINLAPYYESMLMLIVEGQGGIFALDIDHIVGPLNYSRCDTKHRLPCTITTFTDVIMGPDYSGFRTA